MQALYIHGCSHVYGAGLTDPHKESFAAQISNHLEIPVRNLGSLAASVKEVAHKICSTQYPLRAHVLVLWPNFSRSCVISAGQYKKISPSLPSALSVGYYRSYFDTDYQFSRWAYIFRAQHYLCINRVTYCHAFVDSVVEIPTEITPCLDVPNFDQFRLDYPPAPDQRHMGAEGHCEYARVIADKISSFL